VNQGGPPGGPVYIYESEYRDIVAEQRIVYTYEMSVTQQRISVSVATVEFASHDGQNATTQVVITEQGVFLDGHDTAETRKAGTLSFLGALGTFLEAAS
jgi:uncharacterized protein YndB with AHSA1/START domain